MTTAKEAHNIARTLMEIQPPKKLVEYLGDWNTLLLYLEAKIREEKAAHGTQASAEA